MKRRPAAFEEDAVAGGKAPKRQRLPSLPDGSLTLGYYTVQLKLYRNKEEAHSDLGIGNGG